ncbi:MAG: carbohydrate-binding family 9-like protein [Kiritimatiellales bacterium]
MKPSIIKIPRNHSGAESSECLPLLQHWQPEPDPALQPASVRLSWTEQTLLIHAELYDDEIFSAVSGDNQATWRLGDVFEIFLKPENQAGFFEMHVTPNKYRLHLHLPGPYCKPSPEADPLPWEELTVTPCGFRSKVTCLPDRWLVDVEIPADALQLEKFCENDQLQANFCRYDYSKNKPPVLSSVAPLQAADFHRTNDWCTIRLADF